MALSLNFDTTSLADKLTNEFAFSTQPLILGDYDKLVDLITKLAAALCAAWLSIKEISDYFSKRSNFNSMVINESLSGSQA